MSDRVTFARSSESTCETFSSVGPLEDCLVDTVAQRSFNQPQVTLARGMSGFITVILRVMPKLSDAVI